MQISDWTILALLLVVGLNTLFVAGLAIALWVIGKKVDEGLSRAAPLLRQAGEMLARVEEGTLQVQARVEQVLEKTTALVDQVAERVDTTTAIAEEVVTEPLIGAASVMAGIQRGLRVYAERSTAPGRGAADGTNGSHGAPGA